MKETELKRMTKEKQIEEMARLMCANYDEEKRLCGGGLECDHDCWAYREATHLYNADYRKQEWISVEDRLPDEDTRVLVYLNIPKADANTYTFFDTDRILLGKWIRWNKFVSHWMPLPEAPKKGGAE